MTDPAAPGGPRRGAPPSLRRLLATFIGAALLVTAPSLTAAESLFSPVGIVTASVLQEHTSGERDDTPGQYTALLAVTLLYFEPDTALEVYISPGGAEGTAAAYALLGGVTTDAKGRATVGGTVTAAQPLGALTIGVVRSGGTPTEALAWHTLAINAPPSGEVRPSEG